MWLAACSRIRSRRIDSKSCTFNSKEKGELKGPKNNGKKCLHFDTAPCMQLDIQTSHSFTAAFTYKLGVWVNPFFELQNILMINPII